MMRRRVPHPFLPVDALRASTWRESARRVSAYRIPGFGARGGLWRVWAHHPGLSRTVPCAPSRNEPESAMNEPGMSRRIVSEPDGFREAPGSGTGRVASRTPISVPDSCLRAQERPWRFRGVNPGVEPEPSRNRTLPAHPPGKENARHVKGNPVPGAIETPRGVPFRMVECRLR